VLVGSNAEYCSEVLAKGSFRLCNWDHFPSMPRYLPFVEFNKKLIPQRNLQGLNAVIFTPRSILRNGTSHTELIRK